MKKILTSISVFALLAMPTAHAVINVMAGANTPALDSLANVNANFATFSSPTIAAPGVSWSVVGDTAALVVGKMDTTIGAMVGGGSGVTTALAEFTTDPLPSAPTSAVARFYNPLSGLNRGILSDPTANEGTLIVAHLQNATGALVGALKVDWNLSIGNVAPAVPLDILLGHRLYYSVGNGNFLAVPGAATSYGAAGANTVTIPGLTWAAGDTLHFAWVDDNGPTNPDGNYRIDGISFTPTLAPEPTTAALGLLSLGGLLVRRRRA
jgi:MYXO-CTERM domain-containing protein